MVPVPWLFTPFAGIWVIILITLLMAIPATLLAVSFNAMFLEATPANYRAEVVGKRNALLAVSMTLTSLVCGQLLDRVVYPWNYQIVFLIGASGALLSSYQLSKIKMAPNEPSP
jgi:MFS family permease